MRGSSLLSLFTHFTWGGATAAKEKLFTCCTPSVQPCVQLQRCHYIPPPQSHMLRSINHVCNFKDVITSHPPPKPKPTCYVASTMCATSKMSLHVITSHPPQPNPNPACYVASTMCATSKMSLQPQSHMLRSINHVCNFKDVITSHPSPPNPNPTCYVASTMCATSKMSLHPTPPPNPNPTCYVASTMCATSKMSLHVITSHPPYPTPIPHVT